LWLVGNFGKTTDNNCYIIMTHFGKIFHNKLIIGLLLLLIISGKSFTQEAAGNDKRNSIALGFGFLPKHHDETFIPAVELSYMYDLSQRFAVGIGTGFILPKNRFM
jgi:hypothetical protein